MRRKKVRKVKRKKQPEPRTKVVVLSVDYGHVKMIYGFTFCSQSEFKAKVFPTMLSLGVRMRDARREIRDDGALWLHFDLGEDET